MCRRASKFGSSLGGVYGESQSIGTLAERLLRTLSAHGVMTDIRPTAFRDEPSARHAGANETRPILENSSLKNGKPF